MAFEIPIYRFRDSVSFEDGKEMVLRVNGFLRRASGFVSRKTFYDNEGDVWVDVVEWETMQHAIAGSEAFASSELCKDFMALTNPNFNLMHHAEVFQVYAAESPAQIV